MSDLVEDQSQYYIVASRERRDDRTRVLKHADTFAVFDAFGDIGGVGPHEQGLYHEGTRHVSTCELRLEGLRPMLLSSSLQDGSVLLTVDLTNPDIAFDEDRLWPKGLLHVLRMGDETTRAEGRRLFESGRAWIDANLFNGEYYIQQVKGQPREQIAPALMNTMGSDRTDEPEYQMGSGCLADQLIGQYQAEVAGLGPLVDPANCRATLESIYRNNYKLELLEHDNLQRTYVLNDEAALVVAEYTRGGRPDVPFPYYAEAWTGLEYATASLMIYAGLVSQGVECITSVRARYDGERRNPWDEPECGSHYARAMSS